jgi:hypothetical protein
VERWLDVVMLTWPQATVPTGPGVPDVDSLFPSLGGLSRALARGLYMPISAAIAIYYATRVLKRASLVISAVLILGACAAGAGAYTPEEFFFSWGGFLLSSAFTAGALIWLFRDNIAAYALTGFLITSVDGSIRLLEQSAEGFRLHGWIWLGVAGLVVVVLWVMAFRAPRNPMNI